MESPVKLPQIGGVWGPTLDRCLTPPGFNAHALYGHHWRDCPAAAGWSVWSVGSWGNKEIKPSFGTHAVGEMLHGFNASALDGEGVFVASV